jgi:penicillin-binding protein 2
VDIDNELVRRTERAFGKDVQLTIDIDLQGRIEDYLTDCDFNPNCRRPTAAVVMDVNSGEILAMVSVPVFDLNRVRYEYGRYAAEANEPLRNRAINQQYPGGSVIKPLILIAGLESGKISADEVIGCPSKPAGVGWPNCWIYNMYHTGHDMQWTNNARNAIKGSCNIYFSRLADRLEPWVLQNWLFRFGYGRRILDVPAAMMGTEARRNFREMAGVISTVRATEPITSFEQVPPLSKSERRLFGIGQGNLRVTVLQAANAMAAIARDGSYKKPRLIMGQEDSNAAAVDMGISRETLRVVYDGMSAVVNEPEGTAYKEFSPAAFWRQGIDVYGKTGSTEHPDNAWFAGFASDRTGRSIVIAVLVEGGQHGSADAAPLARDIIQFCIEAGYIGQGAEGK